MMDDQLKSNLTSSKHWIRLFFMILFALALQVASIVMTALVAVQFLFALITGKDNTQLRKFGDALSIFIFDTLQFLIYNSEEKPFPFADWPESKVAEGFQKGAEGSDEVDSDQDNEAKPKKPAAKRKAAPKKKVIPEDDGDPTETTFDTEYDTEPHTKEPD